MFYWAATFSVIFYSIPLWFRDFGRLGTVLGLVESRLEIQKVIQAIEECQGYLESGTVPSAQCWSKLRTLPIPWGELVSESVQELRRTGAQVLPTLKRFKNLAIEQRETLKRAKARSALAVSQSLICLSLVPVFGSLLYALLPGLEEKFGVWLLVCSLSALLTGVGAVWMIKQAEAARWGGLSPNRRSCILTAQSGGERLLSLLRGGTPSDLAWVKTIHWVESASPDLAQNWGFSVWKPETQRESCGGLPQCVIDAGRDLKQAIWVAVMEGRSCVERLESALTALSLSWSAEVEREIALLATRNLKPLFLFVAPSLLGLMALGLFLSWQSQGGI